MKKTGFTLAEVLITLVIIGVIGALTVPALIQNTQKQEYVTALKKAYSTLSQVTQQIIMEEGSPKADDGGWAADYDKIYDLYSRHLNLAKKCNSPVDCNFPQCISYLKSSANGRMPGHCLGGSSSSDYKPLALADGSVITFDSIWRAVSADCSKNFNGTNFGCASMFIDVNGMKKPNEFGRDVHEFVITEKGLIPAGCDVEQCAGSSFGAGCTCKVLREGAMNY